MNNYITLLLTMLSLLFVSSCTESYLGIEQIVTDSTPPEKLTVNKVTPKSGALEIEFTLPAGDPSIAQIIASYTNERGEKREDRKSTRLNSSHVKISYAVFCLKKKTNN